MLGRAKTLENHFLQVLWSWTSSLSRVFCKNSFITKSRIYAQCWEVRRQPNNISGIPTLRLSPPPGDSAASCRSWLKQALRGKRHHPLPPHTAYFWTVLLKHIESMYTKPFYSNRCFMFDPLSFLVLPVGQLLLSTKLKCVCMCMCVSVCDFNG